MITSIVLPHGGPFSSPEFIHDFAHTVEDLGFGGLGFFDHLAMPRRVDSLYVLGPEPVGIPEDNLKKTLTPLYECLTTMANVAGITKHVRLTTGILVLPLRNPVYNARQIATIDALSGGRVELGIGIGWLKEEADAMQMPWDQRGKRTEEHIQVLRTLWESNEDYVSFNGEFYQFEPIDPQPQPRQKPLPILIGGHSPAAKRRAGRIGDGWISVQLDVETQRMGMEEVRAAAQAVCRNPNSLVWTGMLDARFDRGAVKSPEGFLQHLRAYRDLGVNNTVIRTVGHSHDDMLALLKWLANEVLPEFPA